MLKASKYEASHKIRFLRVVIDDDVDRMQVYRWRHHSRALLIARNFLPVSDDTLGSWVLTVRELKAGTDRQRVCRTSTYSGDYGTKVPPLPIPNREVKLRHADGTAQVGE